VIEDAARVVGSGSLDAASGKPSLAFAYPLRSRDDTIAGALMMVVNVSELERSFDQLPPFEGSAIAVHDRGNRLVFGSAEARAADRFFGEASLKRAPWMLTLGVPQSVVMARVLPLWRRNTMLTIIVLGGTFLLSLWLATALSRSLRDLHAVTRRMAAGDLTPMASRDGPNREVADLQDSFMTMARSLRQSQDAVTEQVLQERGMKDALQSLQTQVVRQERLAAVGALASGIAHELNNPLQAIQGSAELLERQAVSADMRAELTFIKAQCRRAGEVVRSLSRFSSQPAGPPSAIDLRDVVAEALKLCARNDPANAPAVTVHATVTRRVLASVTELEHVALCLLINAEQAIARTNVRNGRIDIRILDAGDRVRLEMHDNGPGVSAEDEPKLFQPFFTRKPVGQGNGLGLSVSYGIIRALGGTIGYLRNDQGGATFFFELPAVALPDAEPTHDEQAVLRRSV
jgi:C4-dicarboxylate-specific signal transduction histidine kinase